MQLPDPGFILPCSGKTRLAVSGDLIPVVRNDLDDVSNFALQNTVLRYIMLFADVKEPSCIATQPPPEGLEDLLEVELPREGEDELGIQAEFC